MHKQKCHNRAFTLIEVMVAVMIVSTVIAALMQMQGDASNKLIEIKKMMRGAQYSTFLLGNSGKYGFEQSRVDVYELLADFDLESDLRRRLKSMKIDIFYDSLQFIDTDKLDVAKDDDMQFAKQNSGIVFEIGKTNFAIEEHRGSSLRIRIQ